jgi:hypothetical protein
LNRPILIDENTRLGLDDGIVVEAHGELTIWFTIPPSLPIAARGRGASLRQRQRQVEALASTGGDACVVNVGRKHQLQRVDDVLARLFAGPALAHRARHLDDARAIQPSSSGWSYAIVIWSLSFIAKR